MQVDRENRTIIHDGRAIALSEALMECFLSLYDSQNSPVNVNALKTDEDEKLSSVRQKIQRLRRRLQPFGIEIMTVHGTGYMIQNSQYEETTDG